MSTYVDEKLAGQERSAGLRARCLLNRHLCLKDGTPKYSVIESDKEGPVLVEVVTMDVAWRWRRVGRDGKDFIMELE